MARAAQADQEAADAATACDAAAQRASEAQARAAQERAAAAAALAPSSSFGPKIVSSDTPADLRAAMLLQEAAALLTVHSQAIAITNIRSLVTVVLDVDSPTSIGGVISSCWFSAGTLSLITSSSTTRISLRTGTG